MMEKSKVDIGPTMFLAYTDITAAASRALFGLEGHRTYQTLELETLEDSVPACVHPPNARPSKTSPPMDAVQVINCRYEEKNKPQYTFLIINTHIPCEKCHHVARAIVNLCAQRHVMKLVVLSSQRLDVQGKSRLFESTFTGMAPVTGRGRLPEDTLITDAFLSNLIQLCTVEGQPFTVITAPAHRSSPGQANMEDGSLQLIRLFQNTITDFSGLMFSDKFSTSLVYRDGSEEAHSKLMYA